MAITCPRCGAEFDATLFEFGNSVCCDCGTEIEYPGDNRRAGHVVAHKTPRPAKPTKAAAPNLKDNDRIVFILRRDTDCGRCQGELGKGEFICLTGSEAICLKCAGLAHLKYLPAGDTAVTRRATKYSSVSVVVMKRSAARKRSERQGVLVEAEAIRRAEAESAADAKKRARQQAKAATRREKEDQAYIVAFAKAIAEQFPGCPDEDAQEIAAHACQKYSGRVGRSAAAKQFDPTAVRLAVMAHVRHKYTNYDKLLARYDDKQEARREVRGRIEEILARWEQSR